jgi:predicted dithiol-disulfide oxidoreductase (DUF899 family)
MKRIILLIVLCLTSLSLAQGGKPSTPEERQRAVQIAQKLESNPLDEALRPDREWLLKWAAEASDFTVSICASHGEYKKKFKYGPEVTFQKMASAIAFIVQHPDQQADKTAQELAAVQGALKAYHAILKANPKGHSEYWDGLLEKQSSGTLKDFVGDYVASDCSEKSKT